jgi:hypothetical protein
MLEECGVPRVLPSEGAVQGVAAAGNP